MHRRNKLSYKIVICKSWEGGCEWTKKKSRVIAEYPKDPAEASIKYQFTRDYFPLFGAMLN